MAKEKKGAAFEKAAFEWLEKNTDTALLFAQNLVGVLLQNYNGLATHYAKAGEVGGTQGLLPVRRRMAEG